MSQVQGIFVGSGLAGAGPGVVGVQDRSRGTAHRYRTSRRSAHWYSRYGPIWWRSGTLFDFHAKSFEEFTHQILAFNLVLSTLSGSGPSGAHNQKSDGEWLRRISFFQMRVVSVCMTHF